MKSRVTAVLASFALLGLSACPQREPETPATIGDESDEAASTDTLPMTPTAGSTSRSPLAGTDPPRALLAEALRELSHASHTHYQHHTEVDEVQGEYDFDCSGFVGYALLRTAPAAFDELRAATVKRPLAKHFELFFASLTSGSSSSPSPSVATKSQRWTRVPTVKLLRPGDVIAWAHEPRPPHYNTGHTLLVREPPREIGDGEFEVPIIDSTGHPHGGADARGPAHATGLGTGSIELDVDTRGAAIAYRWGLAKHFQRREAAIAMGRLTAPP